MALGFLFPHLSLGCMRQSERRGHLTHQTQASQWEIKAKTHIRSTSTAPPYSLYRSSFRATRISRKRRAVFNSPMSSGVCSCKWEANEAHTILKATHIRNKMKTVEAPVSHKRSRFTKNSNEMWLHPLSDNTSCTWKVNTRELPSKGWFIYTIL